jgi:RNA 2',3'-cyclic 3'-phosphodiesterase
MTTKAAGSTICAFVALELSKALRAAFADEIARLEKTIAGVQWMEPRRMHLTLRFLGWTTRERLNTMEAHLARAAKACPPIDATVSVLGTFPPSGRPRVLWAGIDLPKSGAILQAACEAAALESGFPPERRAFRAHLTLGRWSEPARRPLLPDLALGATRMERLVLYRTEPVKSEASIPGVRRAVSVYSQLAAFPLG